MAVGGALRAAMKAGNWASAARESRRRARALAQLNASGGISNASLSGNRGQGFLPRGNAPYFDDYEGVDPRRGLDWGDFGPGSVGEGVSARGGLVTENPFLYGEYGGRVVYPPTHTMYPFDNMRRPIEAPYEGFRVLPQGGRYDARYGEYMGRGRPGPWMGRGRGTEWMELPFDGGPPYVNGTYFEQYPGPRPLGGPIEARTDRPSFPWRMFADTGVPTPTRRIPSQMETRYSFDDITGVSSFVDPQTGFRYTLDGFPLD